MEIKHRILQSAEALFMRNGIKSVSMDDIAQHLAMSKKTLYKWFENKDQIVLAVAEHHLQMEEAECCRMFEQAENALDELFQMMTWAKRQFQDVHPGIFYDLKKYYPAAWAVWEKHKNFFILEKISDNLRRGMAEGLYRADLNVEVLSRLHLAEIELAFNADLFPARQYNPNTIHFIFLEHFLLGVATLKGHKLINQYRHVTEEE
ncbi:TetR/AcrR family transcriptional regulator [Hymenobacter weizhouensis]|uniref:TetR/AcrR family transcriptional regulator n=1 Tax=Hymenobacter sp. YIM 151500-1 TaxID=2987689 RepID=UPI00222759F0|nr:TetR/AcrR family transcriptional regulator [Hymenobacter sp. YIM 151500-1]UYZ61892.1 TetR/AcrR family transcriptional regulator [Hymenobacter sp. YIM 151500-1]